MKRERKVKREGGRKERETDRESGRKRQVILEGTRRSKGRVGRITLVPRDLRGGK